jgi:hypothetical protein
MVMTDKGEDDDEGVWFGEEDDEDSPFRRRVARFEECSRDELLYPKIFSELGFVYVDDGCDGFCPECENRRTCDVYPELKAEWEELARSAEPVRRAPSPRPRAEAPASRRSRRKTEPR